MGEFNEDAVNLPIESIRPSLRSIFERAYKADPKRTDTELVALGYQSIARQLRIDYQSGKL